MVGKTKRRVVVRQIDGGLRCKIVFVELEIRSDNNAYLMTIRNIVG